MMKTAGLVLKLFLLAALLLAAAPAVATAQSVSGRLMDAESSRPIPAAAILLLRGDSIVGRTNSNSEGVFLLAAPEPGAYRIRAEHLAFQPSTSEVLTIGENERLILDLRMSVAAVVLEAVTVVAAPERRPGELRGFYDRQQRSAAGTFLTREWIEKLGVSTTSQVLQHGGLQVRFDRYGDPQFIGGAQGCMDIIIDGTRRRSNEVSVNVDNIISPDLIEGIEIYKYAHMVPPPHGAAWSDCGAILIWTTYSR